MLDNIIGLVQFRSCDVNQEGSKPSTELKALLSRSRSVVMLHVDSTKMM